MRGTQGWTTHCGSCKIRVAYKSQRQGLRMEYLSGVPTPGVGDRLSQTGDTPLKSCALRCRLVTDELRPVGRPLFHNAVLPPGTSAQPANRLHDLLQKRPFSIR